MAVTNISPQFSQLSQSCALQMRLRRFKMIVLNFLWPMTIHSMTILTNDDITNKNTMNKITINKITINENTIFDNLIKKIQSNKNI